MKKYGKLIAILLIIVLSIGTFYVNSAFSASKFPEFVIKTVSGDEQIAEDVVFSGYLRVGRSGNGEGMQISADGTMYDSEKSFFDRIKGLWIPVIEELQVEHRSFMRGKSADPDNYYEDENYLVYGDIEYQTNGAFEPKDFKFHISILKKQDDKTTAFEIDIPDSSNMNYMNVRDVQVVNGNLKLIAHTRIDADGERRNELRVYRFDIGREKLINQETIVSAEESDAGVTDFRMVRGSNPKQKHKFVVFNKVVMKEIQRNEGSYAMQEQSQGLIAYNVKTGELKKINLPNMQKKVGDIQGFDGSSLYFMKKNDKSMVVKSYNIADKAVKQVATIPLSESVDSYQMASDNVTVNDGKLYVFTDLPSQDNQVKLIVADVETRKTLYKGKIARKNPTKSTGDEYSVHIYEMVIR